MKIVSVILMVLLISGCATCGPSVVKCIISPSQAAYDRADALFKQKDYSGAISAFEKFIKDYPQSNLLPGARLGIAWSHYLRGEYKETVETLAQVRANNQKLAAWITKLSDDAKKRITATGEASSPSLFNIPEFTNQDRLKVEGAAPDGGQVLINDERAPISGGFFSKEINLNPGENKLTIVIMDSQGKVETKTAKVTLDKTPPTIKVTDAEVDDFGYVEIKGITKPGAGITAEGESLSVDDQGIFSGRINKPRNQQINLVAQDRAGNTATQTYSDTDYPNKPTGLRLRSVSASTADIEWDSNQEEDIKGYNIYYSQTGDSPNQKNNREIVRGTTYTLTGLRTGFTYSVSVRAIDKMGNESEPSSDTLTITP
jgi:tetratricopeptide (TPR) repeat protein